MSPVVERGGRFHLDELERSKLYLVWLSCKDFSMLSKTKNRILLKEIWANIKSDLQRCFRSYSTSLGSLVNTFGKMDLTIDPRLPCGYDPEKDVLIFNLWSLFFSLTRDNFAMPSPAWQTGAELVHEFDHYLFFKERDMIGKLEQDYKEFSKKHLSQLEKRAFRVQIEFLEKCKANIPPETLCYKIRIRKWSCTHAIGLKAPVFKMVKEDVEKSIDGMICEISDVISKIDSGEEYDTASTQNSIEKNSALVNILSLPIELDAKKKDYATVQMEM